MSHRPATDRATRRWELLLIAVFALAGAREVIYPIIEPGILGSHGAIYAAAARAWLTGGDPWSVGPPAAIFAGPPTMLLPFVPLAFLPWDVVRFLSVGIAALLAVWVIRRLGLPGYWIGYPPILGSVILGHPELLVLALLVLGGPLSGLAAVVKPYAAFPLLAERRWRAFGVAAAVVVATAIVLPWGRFLAEGSEISATLARQAHGDSVFGNWPLVAVAIVALAGLGLRRGLWLAVPVLWPYAQPGYKAISVPAMSRLLAIAWAIPVPGATVAGLVLEACLVQLARRDRLPAWLKPALDGPSGPMGRGPVAPRLRAAGALP